MAHTADTCAGFAILLTDTNSQQYNCKKHNHKKKGSENKIPIKSSVFWMPVCS